LRNDHHYLGRAYLQKVHMKEAIATFQKSLVLEEIPNFGQVGGMPTQWQAEKADAQAVLSRLQNMSVTNCVAP
jgi:hypothetical protein